VDGDISTVQVANRSALHSDYYSRKKITVTQLNFVCKRRRPRARATRAIFADAMPRRKIFHLCNFAQGFRYHAEMPMKYGFL